MTNPLKYDVMRFVLGSTPGRRHYSAGKSTDIVLRAYSIEIWDQIRRDLWQQVGSVARELAEPIRGAA